MGAEKAPKWRPEVTILEARGRREGHGSEKTKIQKGFPNTLQKRPDFVSGRACPEATVIIRGGVHALGFSHIQLADDVFV